MVPGRARPRPRCSPTRSSPISEHATASGSRPTRPAASRSRSRATRDARRTSPQLRAAIAAHSTPLIEAVNDATKRPSGALERGVEDRIAAAIVWIAQMTQRQRTRAALLDGEAEIRMLDLGTHELLLHVREGCCLYYRLPAGLKCFSCPLIDDEDRRRLVAGGG